MAKEKVEVSVTADDKASSKLETLGKKVSGTFDKFASLGNLLAVGLVAKAFSDLYRALETQEQALMACQVAVENVGVSYADVKDEILEVTSALQKKTTYGDEVQQKALSTLIMMTGDYEKSLKNLDVVLDLSAGLGMSLETTSRYVAMALEGNVTMLGRYVTEFRGANAETMTGSQAMDILRNKFGGMAEAMANTTTGPIVQFKNAIGDIKEDIGLAVIPVFKVWTDIFMALPEGIQKTAVAITFLIPVIFGLGKAIATSIPELRVFVLTLTGVVTTISALTMGFEKYIKNLEELAKTGQTEAETLLEAFQILYDKKPVEDYIGAVDKVKGAIEILTQKRNEEYQVSEDRMLMWSGPETVMYDNQIAKLQELLPWLEEKARLQKESIVWSYEEQQALDDLNLKMLQLGEDEVAFKKAKLDKEYKDKLMAFEKTLKMETDEAKRAKKLAEFKVGLNVWRAKAEEKTDKDLAKEKQELALETTETAIKFLNLIVGQNKDAAIAIIALEKSVAIFKVWSAIAGKSILQPWLIPLAVAQTALLTAQAGVAISAISKAGEGYKAPVITAPEVPAPEISPPAPVPVEVVGGAGGGGGGGVAGGGGTVNYNYFTIHFGLLTTITDSQAQEIVDRLKPYLLDAEFGRGGRGNGWGHGQR